MSRIIGIRGAITVRENTREEIWASSRELLTNIVERNQIEISDICSVIFTCTRDLDAAFPAAAARQLGWTETALLDMAQMHVEGSLPRVIRVLMHVNVARNRIRQPQHVYLREAAKLRPDLSE